MNYNQKEYKIELGKITPLVQIDDYVIRFIDIPGSLDDEADNLSGYSAQGHITSISKSVIDNIIIDISYYNSENQFLGLNTTSSLFNVEELGIGSSIPFDVDLDIPNKTARCVLNISAKELKGLWNRFMLGAKG